MYQQGALLRTEKICELGHDALLNEDLDMSALIFPFNSGITSLDQ